ncbi:MAG: hypothetical protein ACLQBY_07070 [Solirubrobacteraceae bacterium]
MLAVQAPAPKQHLRAVGKDPPPVNRRDVLAGGIYDYHIAA